MPVHGTKNRPIDIMIVDDHQIVRSGVARIIRSASDMRVIALASNGAEIFIHLRKNLPDILLLDLALPGVSALHILKKCRRIHPRMKIIILTSTARPSFPQRTYKLGAYGYLRKDISPATLINALRSVYNGKKIFPPNAMQPRTPSDSIHPKLTDCSNRELEIILMTTQGYNARQIAKQLYISIATVTNYRYQIMKHFNLDSYTQLLRLAVDEGLVEADYV